MNQVKQSEFEDPNAYVGALAEERHMETALAMLLRGYQTAETVIAMDNMVVDHLYECAVSETRTLFELSHKLGALWLEPEPIGPVCAAIKISKTQKMLLTYLESANKESLRRFEAMLEAGSLATVSSASGCSASAPNSSRTEPKSKP